MSSTYTRSVITLSLTATLAGCAGSAATSATTGQNTAQREQAEGTTDGSGDDGVWKPNASELLAVARLSPGEPSPLEPFSVATTGWSLHGAPVPPVEVVNGELRIAGRSGQDVVGARFTATAPRGSQYRMRITRVIPHETPRNDPRSRVHHDYVIEYQHGNAWPKLCRSRDPMYWRDEARGRRRNESPGRPRDDDYLGATVIPGSFGINTNPKAPVSNGDYEPATDRLMFSCRDGVAAKCIDWGYAPWAEHGQMSAYFQACTRMVRADYCGTGHSRTIPGTTINYGDFHHPQIAKFDLMKDFVPEAVWGPGRGTTGHPAALCLARSRWSTIPIGHGSPCADLMPHPGTTLGASVLACEEMKRDGWPADVLFVNASRTVDTGLVRWTDGKGHYQTTAQVAWQGGNVDLPAAQGPAGYPTLVDIEGSIYKDPPPDSRIVPGLVKLYRYTVRAGDTQLSLTTTENAPGHGFGDPKLEGYVFDRKVDAPDDAPELVLYRDDHGSFATTTDPTPPPGFKRVSTIGWLPH
jgi:hypothetical protein